MTLIWKPLIWKLSGNFKQIIQGYFLKCIYCLFCVSLIALSTNDIGHQKSLGTPEEVDKVISNYQCYRNSFKV